MEFYWVNVELTINEVLSGSFLWAPEHTVTQSGKVQHLDHWDNVAKIKTGDIIFCCHNQRVSHIAMATADSYSASRPSSRSFSEWTAEGNRVDVDLVELKTPLFRDEIAHEFISQFNDRTAPSLFTSSGTLKQIYMAHLPQDAGAYSSLNSSPDSFAAGPAAVSWARASISTRRRLRRSSRTLSRCDRSTAVYGTSLDIYPAAKQHANRVAILTQPYFRCRGRCD